MIRALKQAYVSFFNLIVSFMPPSDFNDVLILRLDQLGDFILWLDSAKEYRKLYHNKRLTLLVNANWYDFAKSLPYWDDVIPLDTIKFRLNIFYRLQMMAYIRSKGFEIAISPRHSVKFTLEPPIIATCGATQKIVCEGSFPIEKQNYFTRSIPMRPDVHELIRNADFLRGLGRKDFKCTVPYVPFQKVKLDYEYILLCPISFRKRKNWPIDNYEEIACKLSTILNGKMKLFICADSPIKFYVMTDDLPYVKNMTGQTQVNQFIQIVNNAKLVIANDSAPIHLATAFNVPSICIGVENYGRFFPYQFDKSREGMVLPKLIYKPNIKDITVDEVWIILKDML